MIRLISIQNSLTADLVPEAENKLKVKDVDLELRIPQADWPRSTLRSTPRPTSPFGPKVLVLLSPVEPQGLRGGSEQDKWHHANRLENKGPAPTGMRRHDAANNVAQREPDRDAEVEACKPATLLSCGRPIVCSGGENKAIGVGSEHRECGRTTRTNKGSSQRHKGGFPHADEGTAQYQHFKVGCCRTSQASKRPDAHAKSEQPESIAGLASLGKDGSTDQEANLYWGGGGGVSKRRVLFSL